MTSNDDDLISKSCLVMQIISAALLMGVVALVGVAVLVMMGGNQAAPAAQAVNLPILSLLAAGMFAINVPLSFVLPGIMTRNSLRNLSSNTFPSVPATGNQDPPQGKELRTLLGIRQAALIVSRAVLEGAGFLGGIAYLVEGHWIGLAVALAIVVTMLLTFPTEGRLRKWLENQKAALEEFRLQGQCRS